VDELVGKSVAEGEAPSLFAGFERPREGFHASIWSDDGFVRWDWDDWRREATAMAAGLRALDVEPGSRVACVLTNCPACCAVVPAIWLTGATVLSLPTIARGMSFESYLAQLRRICDATGPTLVLLEGKFAAALPDDAIPGVRIAAYESLESSERLEPTPVAGEEIAFVQYSSGSTSEPHGCALSARAVARQLRILSERLEVDTASDTSAAWLPLSHDMGLFGAVMLGFLEGMSFCLSTPQRFLQSPGTWFDDCAAFGATITAAPNFALELAARAARVELPEPFPMKRCVLGGERVEARSVASAVAALGSRGLGPAALAPAYGMAEAVLAITMTAVGEAPRILEVDAGALIEGEVVDPVTVEDWGTEPGPGRTRLVSAGRPLDGVAVRVAGDARVGELLVSSPSLASGYFADPAATRERFDDGAVRTGDVGLAHEGQLYVVGRLDDMISAGGRNLFARDVEVAMGDSVAVRPGSCVLVNLADAGGGRLLALAEPAREAEDFPGIARSLAGAVRQATGFRLDECLIVAPGTLPKTPSGKIQRYRCRQLLETEGLEPLARIGR
jgi:acyl-CoA synthetase (AMP-forming)/AMP-acid ligase II